MGASALWLNLTEKNFVRRCERLITSPFRSASSQVIENVEFKNFLELVPNVRELIHDFYQSRYASSLTYLEHLKPDLELDIHLHDKYEGLYERIRNRALIQYFSPFTSVSLPKMALAFNTDVLSLERELSRLIMDGRIQARIDSQNKVH